MNLLPKWLCKQTHSQINNQKGNVGIVVVLILVIVTSVFISTNKNLFAEKNLSDTSNRSVLLSVMQNRIVTYLNNSEVWDKTSALAENNMSCASSGASACPATLQPLTVSINSAQVIVDKGSAYYDDNGSVCTNSSTQKCKYKLDLSWQPLCVAPCKTSAYYQVVGAWRTIASDGSYSLINGSKFEVLKAKATTTYDEYWEPGKFIMANMLHNLPSWTNASAWHVVVVRYVKDKKINIDGMMGAQDGQGANMYGGNYALNGGIAASWQVPTRGCLGGGDTYWVDRPKESFTCGPEDAYGGIDCTFEFPSKITDNGGTCWWDYPTYTYEFIAIDQAKIHLGPAGSGTVLAEQTSVGSLGKTKQTVIYQGGTTVQIKVESEKCGPQDHTYDASPGSTFSADYGCGVKYNYTCSANGDYGYSCLGGIIAYSAYGVNFRIFP